MQCGKSRVPKHDGPTLMPFLLKNKWNSLRDIFVYQTIYPERIRIELG